ncbi:LOW QUALITY PROTEIN: hypothetical protein V1478_001882 [Vespula squamosa]|uniref:Uncharacterized protein n=1 Tax=Vespula squamosa TaxID=30214 RepID=A0ABD2BYD5_VESSQ
MYTKCNRKNIYSLVVYQDMQETTSVPGALTTLFSTRAAILRESLPPSIAIPNSFITEHRAVHASYIATPSPANTKLLKASATVIRAPADAFTRPFIGCSPIDVAIPY